MSNLIQITNGKAHISDDDWTLVKLPASQVEVRKQAGKIVLFKLTGEKTVSDEQVANTVIPSNGKVIVPLSVLIARKAELQARIDKNEVGVWLDTHEVLLPLIENQADLNRLPIIVVHVERFADGRIFSIGNL